MEEGCYIEVDVNGEEIFMVDKKILASFSIRLRKLLCKADDSTGRTKIIFHNFPGGAEGFELLARYCYNNGSFEISATNVVLLHCAAHFMEMDSNRITTNLVCQSEKSLEEISFWGWSDLLVALKQCQDIYPASSSSSLLEKVMDCLVSKLAMTTASSPFTWSSRNSSSHLSSCDLSSTYSMRNYCSPTTWWFEDLSFLNTVLLDKAVRMMIYQKLDHSTIFKFLLFHLKSKFLSLPIPEKSKMTEVAINLLLLLDRNCLSCKGLFYIRQLVSRCEKNGKHYKLKLESLIGLQLDEATLGHLLVPPCHRKHYSYDVDFVLRLVKVYLSQGSVISSQVKKVACLMDSYLHEVAPDKFLKPSKFAALVSALPDSARESSDRLYQAIDIYLQVHVKLSEEEKMSLCCSLNQEKLSSKSLKHLARNSKFPSRDALKRFRKQQCKRNNIIHDHGFPKENMVMQEDAHQILHSATNHSTETESLDLLLQEMQRRVAQLEKNCPTMRSLIW
ncbi:hypothetical protein Tsubulata_025523 [Turnera subulata]|uniref:NPH3 domain-containing protein n=1 Tax=Turnera subulata TaxID=218843 RepID=A0A9Q0FHV0_9ROSI|nr:hypothetical protein Tsubulata_025523 [Turnera subulata]